MQARSITMQRVGGLMIGLLIALVAVAALGATASPALAGHNSAAGDAKGTTDGWYDGRTVTFKYPKGFFCSVPPTSGATSKCELGADAVKAPRPGSDIPVLYVMTPIGFRPAESTLQCPEVGGCINHPSTIDLSRVFGAGTENALLPAHSHIVDVAKGGWWEIEVIGVTSQETWSKVVAAKSLDGVRALQADGGEGITGDIPTNLFLFFNVQD